MADNKISGSISGNKLKISVSTNNSGSNSNQGGGSSVQPIESSATKVKSIAEVSSQANQQKNTLNKKQVTQNDKTNQATSIQELQILKNIDKKLQDLNNNIIKIQTLKTSDSKKEETENLKPADKNIFDAKFIEGTNASFVALFNNSNFKTRLKSVLSEIYEDSSLLKASDLETFKSEISETISSSSYTVPNEEKAVNQVQYVNLSKETLDAINQQVGESNAALSNESASSIEKIGESIKTYTEKVEASSALNTKTSDEQINSINNLMKERAAEVSQEKQGTENIESNITATATENDMVEKKEEVKSLDEMAEGVPKELEKEGDKPAAEADEFNNQIVEKLDSLNDSLVENKESIDQLIEERQIDRDLKESAREEFIAMHEEKKKMMAEKTNKSNSIMGILKSSLSKASSSIKNVGRSLVLSKPMSKVRSVFQKESGNKNITQKKGTPIKIIEQKTISQKDGIDSKRGAEGVEGKKITPIDLLKEQKTISQKDGITNLRNVGQNSASFLMGQNMNKVGTINKNVNASGKNPLGELFKISAILSGFMLFYKKMAKSAEDRELYKLRFGQEKKSDTGMWEKFLGLFKGKKGGGGAKKEAKEDDGTSWWMKLIGRSSKFSLGWFKVFWQAIRKISIKRSWGWIKIIRQGPVEINNMAW